ncbi:MAG: Nramp family divalent metal transporter [Phycisphaeraceae bacterium]
MTDSPAPTETGTTQTDPPEASQTGSGKPRGLFRSLGPAIIVASVVLGPGSILLASTIGIQFGYSLLWVPLFSTALMICLVAIAARLGVVYERTLCDELAHRLGRPAAVFVGIVVFLIIAGFQTSNNTAILAAIDPLLETVTGRSAGEIRGTGMSVTILVLLNAFVIAVLFGFKRLYSPLEKLMMGLVLIMLVGFLVNLAYAAPSLPEILGGLIPSVPQSPNPDEPVSLTPVIGFFATTVSIAAAFYQAYLVREKGWGIADVKRGMGDAFLGIALLGGISMIIMITAAAVLHGAISAGEIGSAGDIARQLEPLFGPAAVILFSLGLFAGAFSSFLVNAMIGGTILSDGLGYGGRMDQQSTRVLTAVALLLAMAIAIYYGGEQPVVVIQFAQALTVLGLPVLALTMLYLATRPDLKGPRAIPLWMNAVLVLGCVIVFLLAARTANNLFFS